MKTATPAFLTGNARRAAITASVFAFVYTLWGVVCVFYFYYPASDDPWRLSKILHFPIFVLGAIPFICFALLALRDGSLSPALVSEMKILSRDWVFRFIAVWFLWACIALIPAMREGYANSSNLLSNMGSLLDQFVNTAILFPLGYLFARKRDKRLLTAVAAACFIGFLPYLVMGGVFTVNNRSFRFLGRLIDYTWDHRLQMGENSNVIGYYAATAFTAAIYLINESRRKVTRVLLIVSDVLIFYIILKTASRASTLAAAVGAIYYAIALFVRRGKEKQRRISSAARTLIVALLSIAALSAVILVLYRMTGRSLFTLLNTTRFRVYLGSLQVIIESPHILAHGVSAAGIYDVLNSLDILYHLSTTHNQFLEVWLGQGTPALLLFLASLFPLARRCLTVSLRGKSVSEGGNWAASLFVLTLFIVSMAEVILVNKLTSQGNLFCLAAGAVCGMASLLREGKEKERL